MGSLWVPHKRTQARFQGALSGNHEWTHCGAPCGLLRIALLIQILKSPQRSYQPEMYGSIDAKYVFTRSCISRFGIWPHFPSDLFAEKWLCFSWGDQWLPNARYYSDRLHGLWHACFSVEVTHLIIFLRFIFSNLYSKEVWILLPVLSTV